MNDDEKKQHAYQLDMAKHWLEEHVPQLAQAHILLAREIREAAEWRGVYTVDIGTASRMTLITALRDRTGCGFSDAKDALGCSGWNIKKARKLIEQEDGQ